MKQVKRVFVSGLKALLNCAAAQVRALTYTTVAALGAGLTGCGTATTPSTISPQAEVHVSGVVLDLASRPLDAALVEILDGPQAGKTTTTAIDGAFSLTGVFNAATRIRATKSGYVPITLLFKQQSMSFLLPLTPIVDLSGSYTLTVEIDPACTDLPKDYRTRTYGATIAPTSPGAVNTSFLATLSGPGLDGYFRHIWLWIEGEFVHVNMSDNDILEEVAPEAYLEIGGVGRGQVSASGSPIAVPLQAGIDYCVVNSEKDDARYPCSGDLIAHVQCRSTNSRLTFTRR